MNKSFEQSKDEIAQLCEYFATNHKEYLTPGVKEAHVRQSLIDPFFEALGWDVRNTARIAPQYREVIPEDSLDVEGHQKAPDYCFRVGTLPKFYAEAKKCGINIMMDPGPAYQLRRYGWSAKVVLSILTDFEELAVYDCTKRPKPSDKASHARIQYFQFNEYPDRWREIWDIFSREAVWSGAFDEYAASKRKRGTSEVDIEFLREIEGWRDMLARNIALRNMRLSCDDLNAAVQRTIDRIVFLRMAEDRGIEPYEQLLKLCERPNIYNRFINDLCFKADEKYNSGLFHFHKETGVSEAPDQITPKIKIDDTVIKTILQSLYFAHGSPYHFGVFPVEILGTVYERFLGKVIRLTAGHHAKIEEKPEVRKAGGVYYTPAYIVDYIIEHTVGKQIECKSPAQLAGGKKKEPFRVLDMACGSGSFLLGAYQYLLDHCLKWYIEHEPARYKKAVYKDKRNGQWHLMIGEKKRILTTHIFGVDIDPQAVEVTKLSLLLKVLEGETAQTIGQQMQLFHERALPNLAYNIKCGNSLIGSGYFEGRLIVDKEEIKRVNPFNWKQVFPDAMKAGGFDAIIGNPPWGVEFLETEKDYFRTHYDEVHVRTPESFNYFVYRMWKLTKTQGVVGTIIPSSFLTQYEFWKTRKLLVDKTRISRLCNLGNGVFQRVTAPACILIFGVPNPQNETLFVELRQTGRDNLPAALNEERGGQLAIALGRDSEAYTLQMRRSLEVILKCNRFPKLKEVAEDVATGVSSGLDIAYVYTMEQAKSLKLEKDLLRKLVIGGEIHRYLLNPVSGKVLVYTTSETKINEFPNCHAVLLPYRDRLMKRREAANGKIPWFSLNWPRRRKLFEQQKILIRQTADHIMAAFDADGWYCLKSSIIVQIRDETQCTYLYLLAVLNSRLMRFLYNDLVGEQARVFPEVKPVQLFKLPIRIINFLDATEKSKHGNVVAEVDKMMALKAKLRGATSESEKAALQNAVTTTDAKINRLIYDLYGLTKKEIAIVEKGNDH